jgi:hypothetical protein
LQKLVKIAAAGHVDNCFQRQVVFYCRRKLFL